MPTKTRDEVEQKVLAARAERRDGPDVLGPKVGVPARTVSRILRRHHVPYLRELDPITGEVIRSSKQTGVRYERERPGELVHMDVKKLGKIPRRRWVEGPRPRGPDRSCVIAAPRSDTTTCTRSSTTTPAGLQRDPAG